MEKTTQHAYPNQKSGIAEQITERVGMLSPPEQQRVLKMIDRLLYERRTPSNSLQGSAESRHNTCDYCGTPIEPSNLSGLCPHCSGV